MANQSFNPEASPLPFWDVSRYAHKAMWLGTVEASSVDGFQFWLLTGLADDGTPYGDYDGFRVMFPSSTADLMKAAATTMAG